MTQTYAFYNLLRSEQFSLKYQISRKIFESVQF